jgi:hypothetical protein
LKNSRTSKNKNKTRILHSKQVNKQVNKQTNKQVNKQTNKQVNKQVNKQTNKQVNKQTNNMTMKRTRTTTTTFASVLLLLLASATTVTITVTATVAAVSDPHLESVKEIWAWIDSAKDGFVTKKQSVSRMVEENIDTPLIVFANQDIKRGELLVQTPWSHILQSEDPDKDDKIGWYCGATRKLAEEMKKGADSFYAPYVTYINDEPDGQLPTQYSFSAKQLLWQVIGLHRDELNRSQVFDRKEAFDHRLMPEFLTDGLERNWYKTCQADRDDATMAKAASMIIQRADDDILIPAYDAYNHRNVDNHNDKRYMNARTQTTDEQFHQTFAQRDIQKGEQIFISYNMCEQCGGRRDYGFGTAEIFREYGFVEWFPQRWCVCVCVCIYVCVYICVCVICWVLLSRRLPISFISLHCIALHCIAHRVKSDDTTKLIFPLPCVSY